MAVPTATANAATGAVGVAVATGDWAVSYALDSSAVAAASLFSVDAVSYFGDKAKTTLAPDGDASATSAASSAKRSLVGAALSALVRSAVAYDAVEHATLLGTIPRPSTVDESAEAALGVVSVSAGSSSSRIEMLCLASNPRLAEALKTLPSSRLATGVSFAQMQLLVDFTSSYFMRSSETRAGTVVCRAFRLVPYNLAAMVFVVLALVCIAAMLLDERSPVAVRRITRVLRARATARKA